MLLGNVTCSILVGIIPTLNADSSPRPGWAQGLAQVGPQLRGPGPTWVRAHAGPGGNPKIEIGAGGAPTLKNTCTNSRRRRRTTQRPSCEYSPRGSSQLHDFASLFLWCLQKRGGGGGGLPLDLCRRSARNALPECDQTGSKREEGVEGGSG